MADQTYRPKVAPMVWRVAKALCEARIFLVNADDGVPIVFEETSARNQMLYCDLARIAIRAMRKRPTTIMLEAGVAAYETPGQGFLIGAWRAMVRAALEE